MNNAFYDTFENLMISSANFGNFLQNYTKMGIIGLYWLKKLLLNWFVVNLYTYDRLFLCCEWIRSKMDNTWKKNKCNNHMNGDSSIFTHTIVFSEIVCMFLRLFWISCNRSTFNRVIKHIFQNFIKTLNHFILIRVSNKPV